MTEQLLQFIWKYRLYVADKLLTDSNEEMQVLRPGDWNLDAGADFQNARIKLADTTLAGNIEVELNSSNWFAHGHHKDKSHNNTILIVVNKHDAKENLPTPVLEIGPLIDKKLLATYDAMMQQQAWIPCAKHISKVDEFIIKTWLQRLAVERMQEKVEPILKSLEQNQNNWEETFYHTLARNFGFSINSVPFELLAKSLPLMVIAKHKNDLKQIEALLLGQAGFLQGEADDDYTKELKKEYGFLAHKFSLSPINVALWKFAKTRPANFPTMRVAQFAALIHKSSHLFSKIIETRDARNFAGYFSVSASEYWHSHYRLCVVSENARYSLGEDAVNTILVNTVAPFLFAYGLQKDTQEYKSRALYLLESLVAEGNRITNGFAALKVKAKTAADSQALIHLYKNYCTPKKCLRCTIGHKILSMR